MGAFNCLTMIGASTLYDSIATKAGGLHENNIDWYEDYDEPAMRELPKDPWCVCLQEWGLVRQLPSSPPY
jgi:hypothetical protein